MGIAATHTRIVLGAVGVGLLVLSSAAAGGALALGGVPVGGINMAFVPVVCALLGLKNIVRHMGGRNVLTLRYYRTYTDFSFSISFGFPREQYSRP